jgi:hypothetical protein
MTIEDLKKQLLEKEENLKKVESVFYNLAGQVALLKELIQKEESKKE